jgi:hypothetical protein
MLEGFYKLYIVCFTETGNIFSTYNPLTRRIPTQMENNAEGDHVKKGSEAESFKHTKNIPHT